MKSVLWLVCLVSASSAQQTADFEYLRYLTTEARNREALWIVDSGTESLQADTAAYFRGMNYYYLRVPDSAALWLTAVQPRAALYTQAAFFAAINYNYAKQHSRAQTVLASLSSDTLMAYQALASLTHAGTYLLLRDFASFDSVSASFVYNNYRYVNEQKRLVELRNELLRQKKRSPALAGVLSALVPGLGKYYAGRKGAALAAFATTAALGLVAAETWYRGGPDLASPQFVTSAVVFSFFYAGNVAGSVYSVKQNNRSFNGRINNEILANIHRAVVRSFN